MSLYLVHVRPRPSTPRSCRAVRCTDHGTDAYRRYPEVWDTGPGPVPPGGPDAKDATPAGGALRAEAHVPCPCCLGLMVLRGGHGSHPAALAPARLMAAVCRLHGNSRLPLHPCALWARDHAAVVRGLKRGKTMASHMICDNDWHLITSQRPARLKPRGAAKWGCSQHRA